MRPTLRVGRGLRACSFLDLEGAVDGGGLEPRHRDVVDAAAGRAALARGEEGVEGGPGTLRDQLDGAAGEVLDEAAQTELRRRFAGEPAITDALHAATDLQRHRTFAAPFAALFAAGGHG